MPVGEIGGGDVYQQGAVDVLAVTGVLAHTVCDDALFLRGGGHHLPARADAEGKGAAAVGQVAGQLIGSRRQSGMARQLPVAGGVYRRLAVLDADAHGEGLGLHGEAGSIQRLKGIPRTVAQSQDQSLGGNGVKGIALPAGDGSQGPALCGEALQPRTEADVRTGVQQLLAQGLQGDVELVGAYMWQRVGEDAPRCAAGHQLLHDVAVAEVAGAGVQLAVRESACAALAELDVALGVQPAGAPEACHVPAALLHGLPALQQDGAGAAAGQYQSGEQARGACTHHDGAHLRRGHGGGEDVMLRRVGGDALIAAAAEQGGLLRSGDGHGVDEGQTLPCIDGAAQHRQVPQGRRVCPQQTGAFGRQVRFRLVRQQAQLVDPQQMSHLVFKKLKFPAET